MASLARMGSDPTPTPARGPCSSGPNTCPASTCPPGCAAFPASPNLLCLLQGKTLPRVQGRRDPRERTVPCPPVPQAKDPVLPSWGPALGHLPQPLQLHPAPPGPVWAPRPQVALRGRASSSTERIGAVCWAARPSLTQGCGGHGPSPCTPQDLGRTELPQGTLPTSPCSCPLPVFGALLSLWVLRLLL